MAAPALGNFSCPLQQNEGDIPIVWHDIRSKVDGLRRTFRTLLHRDRAICPFQVNGIPVTPHKNPITDMTSKHIIRLWDSKPPKQHEHRRCVVDLLMQDCDGYFAAFRRIEFTVEQLEAALAGAGNGQGLLGRWFSLQGMVVPAFLNAREAEISSSHNGARPGGDTVFESILYTLAKFETDNGEPGVVTPDVQRAAWNVMVMLCEIRRLRSLLVLVNHRIQYDLVPHKLSDGFWKLIRNWSNFSKIVLIARRDGNLELTDQLQKSWCSTFHNKTKMECLIGINGELLEIKLDPTLVGMTIKEFEQRWREAGGNVPEPGFVPQM